MSLKTGFAAEQQARAYLVSQGLKWLESNYRCRWGEIDLIMKDKTCLVFIEVRARLSSSFGGALASVTFGKQQKLLKTASHYLMLKKIQDKQPVRFDVIGLQGPDSQVDWIQNAFGLNF
ncbi:YraN family protein [Legionella fairfieldensis]|uniref:YraN family protein n=1 Tax=Legionella fairfieldensis TaxID=45064 RepID=UPI00048E9202|nr:YraN family protein [Legionella fairfieldensis]